MLIRCPCHEDSTPSLSVDVRDGKLLVKCFAGCPSREVLKALAGMDHQKFSFLVNSKPAVDHREYIKRLLTDSRSICGTPGERYLVETRGIGMVPDVVDLRWHPDVRHGPSKRSFGCIIGVYRDAGGMVTGIQRQWIDGIKKADVEPVRMSLGVWRGSLVGSAMRLCAGPPEVVGEGIETVLSVGRPGWACGSARLLAACEGVCDIDVLADRDRAGMKASRDLVTRVGGRVLLPPKGMKDFNDGRCRGSTNVCKGKDQKKGSCL